MFQKFSALLARMIGNAQQPQANLLEGLSEDLQTMAKGFAQSGFSQEEMLGLYQEHSAALEKVETAAMSEGPVKDMLDNLQAAFALITKEAEAKSTSVSLDLIKDMEPKKLEKVQNYLKAAANFCVKCISLGMKDKVFDMQQDYQDKEDYKNYVKSGREAAKKVRQALQ